MCAFMIGQFFVQPHTLMAILHLEQRRRRWQTISVSNLPLPIFLCRIFRFQFELSSQFQFLFVCRECLGLKVLIVLTFLSFRFFRTVLQGRNRQNPFHGQASPVGVWSFLSLSSTRKMTGAENPPPSNFRKLVLGCIEAKICK